MEIFTSLSLSKLHFIPVLWAEIRPGRDSTPNLGPLSDAVKKATRDGTSEIDSRSTHSITSNQLMEYNYTKIIKSAM